MKTKKATKTFATHITTPSGERIYLRAKSKAELDEKVFAARVEMRAGVDITSDHTFAECARVWLNVYKKGKVRPSSYQILEHNMNAHVIPFFGDMKVRDIKPMHVQMFLSTLEGYSKSLQLKCISLARNVFRFAADNGFAAGSPMRKEDRATADDPAEEEPLTNEQARVLLAALEGTRAYSFCLLALSTGMRRGEILGLMWEDIDFEARLIHVTHNKSFPMNATDAPVTELLKTEAASRNLPLSPLLTEHLLSLRADSSSPYVLSMANGKSLSKSAFRALWRQVERRTAGSGEVPRELGEKYGSMTVSLDFDVHPHQLRHTYITQLFEAGLDLKQVQYLAGHAKPEMTMRVYTHYRNKQRAAETHAQVCDALGYLA